MGMSTLRNRSDARQSTLVRNSRLFDFARNVMQASMDTPSVVLDTCTVAPPRFISVTRSTCGVIDAARR